MALALVGCQWHAEVPGPSIFHLVYLPVVADVIVAHADICGILAPNLRALERTALMMQSQSLVPPSDNAADRLIEAGFLAKGRI